VFLASGASWFETRGFAALLTMRVLLCPSRPDLIPGERRLRRVSKDASTWRALLPDIAALIRATTNLVGLFPRGTGRYRAGSAAGGGTMITDNGFRGIIAALDRRRGVSSSTRTTMTSLSRCANAQRKEDRGRGGDDANVSITRIYLRHSGFPF
jgi:hypothetical protein